MSNNFVNFHFFSLPSAAPGGRATLRGDKSAAALQAFGETRRQWRFGDTERFIGVEPRNARNNTKKFLWLNSLHLCVPAGNKNPPQHP